MRTAFAAYARGHEAPSIRRCWSTWNVLCTFLYTGEMLAANPMQLVGRPKLAKPLPRALPRTAVEALLATVASDEISTRQTDWAERDLAIILTALLAGLRAEELCQADIGDIHTTDNGSAIIHVKGKGGKERSVPIEIELLSVIETYLDSRAIRFPNATRRKGDVPGSALSRWPARTPLFVGRDGERITRGHCNRESSEPSNARVLGGTGPWHSGARPAAHLCHRTGQLRGQRVHPYEVATARVNDDVAAIRRRRGYRNTKCCNAEPRENWPVAAPTSCWLPVPATSSRRSQRN